MTGIPFFLCFPAWQTLRSWAFGAVTWNFNMKPCHRKRLMLSLTPNGITKNPPTIESIGRKLDKKSILVVYYGDKITRYSYRAKKTLSFAAAQPLGRAAKAKMRSSEALRWVENPSFLRFSRRKFAAIGELSENWRKEKGVIFRIIVLW